MNGHTHAFLAAMLDVDDEVDEGIFNDWYNKEHVPERLACPGFLAARRFVAPANVPKYLTIYELDSVDAIKGAEYLSLMNTKRLHGRGSDLTKYIVPKIKVYGSNLFTEIPTADRT